MRIQWSAASAVGAMAWLALNLTAGAQDPFGQRPAGQAADFGRIGANQTEALKVADAIYQGIGEDLQVGPVSRRCEVGERCVHPHPSGDVLWRGADAG